MTLFKKLRKKIWPVYKKISYSQCGEDIIVKNIFDNLLKIEQPTYMDIGANHPKKISNTYLLYKNGSNGVLIEPDPTLHHRIQRVRGARDECLNIGIGAQNGILEFFILSVPELNSFSKKEVDRVLAEDSNLKLNKVIKVPVRTINNVLSKLSYVPDFLSLDVEGLDLEILESLDLNIYRPKVICVETVEYVVSGLGNKNLEIINYLEENGYIIYSDTYINSIFIDGQLIKLNEVS